MVSGSSVVEFGCTAGQESERTLWRHRDFVRTRVGTRYEPGEARQVVETAIRAAVEAKDDPADLINVALDEVVRAGLELPGYSTFDKIAGLNLAPGALFPGGRFDPYPG